MIPKISVCCFIRDNNRCGFGLWESMASLIPFADEYIVLDCGSTDDTVDILRDLVARNPRIRLEHSSFYYPDGSTDASVFADRANDVIAMCKNDLVLYHQADEIFHEDLLNRMRMELEALNGGIPEDWKGMNFWRVQLQENLQVVKWYPHPVNRLDLKSRMLHIGDGMNTNRPWDPPFVGDYDGGATWEVSCRDNPSSLPTHHMILDISATGMWLDNIVPKRAAHAPHWHENADTLHGWGGGSRNIFEWVREQKDNMNWHKRYSPFNIPKILYGLLGEQSYFARREVLESIANDKGINERGT